MESFGAYDVVRRLGAGGFGAVYEVRHRDTGAVYALKALLPLHDEEERRRFEREAEAMGRLDHPHVARVHAAELEGARPYLVQELLGGGDLARQVKEGPLELERALELTRQVASGLTHAHAAGVLHRDLKPGNVLLDEQGQAKLVDFGLARLSGRSRLTETHAVMGTPAYMAPEQARGEAYDERSDVYALGALLYTLLAGAPPFRSRGNVLALLAAINKEPPPPLSERRPEAPRWVTELCERALAKDPAERPGSVEEVLRALEERGEPSGRTPGGSSRVVAALVVVGALALAVFARSQEEGQAPSPSGSAGQRATPGAPHASASPLDARLLRSRWSKRIQVSQGLCGAWLESERLLTLDEQGRALVWSLEERGVGANELVCQIPDLKPNAWPLAFWRREGAWHLAYFPRGVLRASSERTPEPLRGLVRFCQPSAAGAWITGKDRLELVAWSPERAAPVLFRATPPAGRGVDPARFFISGVAEFPGEDRRLLVWSYRRIFLWEPARPVRLLSMDTGSHYKTMGAAVHPDGDRFVWVNSGSLARVGRASQPLAPREQVQELKVPDAYRATGFRGVVFLRDGRICVAGQLRENVVIMTWSSERDLPRIWERRGGDPITLSLAPEGDLLAIGTRLGEVILVGVERLRD